MKALKLPRKLKKRLKNEKLKPPVDQSWKTSELTIYEIRTRKGIKSISSFKLG